MCHEYCYIPKYILRVFQKYCASLHRPSLPLCHEAGGRGRDRGTRTPNNRRRETAHLVHHPGRGCDLYCRVVCCRHNAASSAAATTDGRQAHLLRLGGSVPTPKVPQIMSIMKMTGKIRLLSFFVYTVFT